MPNPRPKWCPHVDCEYLFSFQDACCGGKLPEPVPHEEDFNTHRFCILSETVFDLQVNHNDLFVLTRLLGALKENAEK